MFGKRLKMLRDEKGLNQVDFAKIINVSQGTIGNWETGKRMPDADTLIKLAKYFSVTVDYLLGKTTFRNNAELIEAWGVNDPYFDAQFDFGTLLKQEREEQGISIGVMSADVGLSASDLEDVEEGILPLNKELAEKLSNYLGTNTDQLLFDNNLYDGEVPEEYYDNVREWERLCAAAEEEAAYDASFWSPLTPDAHRIGRAYEKATPPVQRTVEVALEPFMGEQPKKGLTAAKNEDTRINMVVYDQPAAAGLGNYLDGTEYIEISFPAEVVPRGADFGVRINGDSMTPDIPNGCVVFVKAQPVIEHGQIGIFILDGNSYCKELCIDRINKKIRLVSLNCKYDDIIVGEEDNLRTVGRVLGHTGS